MTAPAPQWTAAARTVAYRSGTVLVSAIEEAEELCERWPLRPGPPNVSQRRTPSTATCALRPDPVSVGTAREFARGTLSAWRLSQLSGDVSLVVSELVTNALRHAVPDDPEHYELEPYRSRPLEAAPWIQLIMLTTGSQLLCAVRDSSSRGPIRREPDYIAQTGRGLHLVESFSLAWGWVPVRGNGKVVWAMFPAPY